MIWLWVYSKIDIFIKVADNEYVIERFESFQLVHQKAIIYNFYYWKKVERFLYQTFNLSK
jgi:hypothetical protein